MLVADACKVLRRASRAEHVVLGWAPPEDDGGCPITGYQVRMMDVESGGGEFITVADVRKSSVNIRCYTP